jgi:hypothetical protein
MVAFGISAKGQIRLYIIPETGKVNGEFMINYIPRLIVEKDITRLYPGEEYKVTINMVLKRLLE